MVHQQTVRLCDFLVIAWANRTCLGLFIYLSIYLNYLLCVMLRYIMKWWTLRRALRKVSHPRPHLCDHFRLEATNKNYLFLARRAQGFSEVFPHNLATLSISRFRRKAKQLRQHAGLLVNGGHVQTWTLLNCWAAQSCIATSRLQRSQFNPS